MYKDDNILNNKDENKILINIIKVFKNLEKLDLSENEISDINILENVNFKELKELYLKNNKFFYILYL